MLSLTRRTEYALIAICHLARVGPQRFVSARDIHEQHGVPLPLLMNVLKKLNHAGHVASQRGARGGYSLTRAPAELSLTQVIEAIEGPVQFVRCADLDKNNPRCALTRKCPIQRSVHKVHRRLREFLCNVTIAEMAFDGWERPADTREAVAE